jgi:hypothetical protein
LSDIYLVSLSAIKSKLNKLPRYHDLTRHLNSLALWFLILMGIKASFPLQICTSCVCASEHIFGGQGETEIHRWFPYVPNVVGVVDAVFAPLGTEEASTESAVTGCCRSPASIQLSCMREFLEISWCQFTTICVELPVNNLYPYSQGITMKQRWMQPSTLN